MYYWRLWLIQSHSLSGCHYKAPLVVLLTWGYTRWTGSLWSLWILGFEKIHGICQCRTKYLYNQSANFYRIKHTKVSSWYWTFFFPYRLTAWARAMGCEWGLRSRLIATHSCLTLKWDFLCPVVATILLKLHETHLHHLKGIIAFCDILKRFLFRVLLFLIWPLVSMRN